MLRFCPRVRPHSKRFAKGLNTSQRFSHRSYSKPGICSGMDISSLDRVQLKPLELFKLLYLQDKCLYMDIGSELVRFQIGPGSDWPTGSVAFTYPEHTICLEITNRKSPVGTARIRSQFGLSAYFDLIPEIRHPKGMAESTAYSQFGSNFENPEKSPDPDNRQIGGPLYVKVEPESICTIRIAGNEILAFTKSIKILMTKDLVVTTYA